MNYICLDGKILPADEPVLLASNRGYRYGDGLFETMKVQNEKILFLDYHLTRLGAGLFDLQFERAPLFFEKIEEQVLILCRKNNCEKQGRVRLSVSRGNGGLYDGKQTLQYIIECWPLSESGYQLNEDGLVIDVSPGPRKNCDNFANFKSANFLPYSWAAVLAKQKKWNDCLVLNNRGTIADSTIANCFVIKDGMISTPSLKQGCVKGVMRRWLIENLIKAGYRVEENELTVDQLLLAEEVFLTNVINGIRWVKQFRDKTYLNTKTKEIFNQTLGLQNYSASNQSGS